MLNNIVLSRYQNTNSFLHKLNALEKIITLCLFIAIILLTNDVIMHIEYVIVLVSLIIISKVSFKEYLYSLRTMLYLFIGIFLINLLLNVSMETNITSLLKILETILVSSLVTLTTKENSMINSLVTLFYPLKIFKINTLLIAQIFNLTLKFIPCIIDCINKIIFSLKARGVNFKKNKLLILRKIILPTFNLTLTKADALALSMEARMYNINNKKREITKWHLLDSLIIIYFITLLVEVIICDI